jgi:hypothetical protein
MDSNILIGLELLLVLGLALGFGLWELRSLRRSKPSREPRRRRRARRDRPES